MKPMLMNTEMVKAILDNRKTVTRRVVRPQPINIVPDKKQRKPIAFFADLEWVKPPYQPDDVLYVRETFGIYSPTYGTMPKIFYKADSDNPENIKWRPSIHMPKEAARIFLRVTDVRVEKLQDITDDQTKAEGIHSKKEQWQHIDFVDMWNSTIKKTDFDKYGWNANPWVWVIDFERISKEEAMSNDK